MFLQSCLFVCIETTLSILSLSPLNVGPNKKDPKPNLCNPFYFPLFIQFTSIFLPLALLADIHVGLLILGPEPIPEIKSDGDTDAEDISASSRASSEALSEKEEEEAEEEEPEEKAEEEEEDKEEDDEEEEAESDETTHVPGLKYAKQCYEDNSQKTDCVEHLRILREQAIETAETKEEAKERLEYAVCFKPVIHICGASKVEEDEDEEEVESISEDEEEEDLKVTEENLAESQKSKIETRVQDQTLSIKAERADYLPMENKPKLDSAIKRTSQGVSEKCKVQQPNVAYAAAAVAEVVPDEVEELPEQILKASLKDHEAAEKCQKQVKETYTKPVQENVPADRTDYMQTKKPTEDWAKKSVVQETKLATAAPKQAPKVAVGDEKSAQTRKSAQSTAPDKAKIDYTSKILPPKSPSPTIPPASSDGKSFEEQMEELRQQMKYGSSKFSEEMKSISRGINDAKYRTKEEIEAGERYRWKQEANDLRDKVNKQYESWKSTAELEFEKRQKELEKPLEIKRPVVEMPIIEEPPKKVREPRKLLDSPFAAAAAEEVKRAATEAQKAQETETRTKKRWEKPKTAEEEQKNLQQMKAAAAAVAQEKKQEPKSTTANSLKNFGDNLFNKVQPEPTKPQAAKTAAETQKPKETVQQQQKQPAAAVTKTTEQPKPQAQAQTQKTAEAAKPAQKPVATAEATKAGAAPQAAKPQTPQAAKPQTPQAAKAPTPQAQKPAEPAKPAQAQAQNQKAPEKPLTTVADQSKTTAKPQESGLKQAAKAFEQKTATATTAQAQTEKVVAKPAPAGAQQTQQKQPQAQQKPQTQATAPKSAPPPQQQPPQQQQKEAKAAKPSQEQAPIKGRQCRLITNVSDIDELLYKKQRNPMNFDQFEQYFQTALKEIINRATAIGAKTAYIARKIFVDDKEDFDKMYNPEDFRELMGQFSPTSKVQFNFNFPELKQIEAKVKGGTLARWRSRLIRRLKNMPIGKSWKQKVGSRISKIFF